MSWHTGMSYPEFNRALFKRGETVNDFNPSQKELLHAAIGAAGEAGEILDCVKKHAFYDQPLNEENLKEEIGDTLFYLTALCNIFGWSLGDLMFENMAKLAKRYPDGAFSNKDAAERKDKA